MYIFVLTIESAIPASDCRGDNYLFDWRRCISYLVLED